jgi:ribosome biogenesis GTPase
VAVDRGRYTCLVETRPVTAMRARELGRKSVVVGDDVELVGDLTGGPDALARIVRISPRRSTLRRTADDDDPVERLLVANADQLAIVTAAADPEPRPRLIDRCLVAAYDAGMSPLLVITKVDLASPDPLLEAYLPLGVEHVLVTRGAEVERVRALLASRMTVLVGPSGVGKSTLVNALVPGAGRRTGIVNVSTGRGRHTSTSTVVLALPGQADSGDDGWVIDTPGIRSFGIAHVEAATIVAAFPDLTPGLEGCPRGCTHDEAECGLDAWVATGHADPARLLSLRRLLRNREGRDEDVTG